MLGSHNSISYLPIKGWKKILKPWIKCQDLTIEEQYNQGVRYFDLRVRKVPMEGWWYCHNSAVFVPVMEHKEILEFLIEKKCHIRIILDVRKKPKDAEDYITDFLELVTWLRKNGLNVDSVKVMWEWKEYCDPEILQYEYHSSVSAPWYKYILGTKWFAKKENKTYKEWNSRLLEMDDIVLMIDYIEL